MQLKEALGRDIKANRVQYLFIVFLLVVGITAGTFTVSNLRESARHELSDYISLLLLTVKAGEIKYFGVFIFSWLQNTLLFLSITAFSLLMVGIPVVAAIIIFKGFCIGFTVGVLSLSFGTGGFFAIVVAMFLPNIILIPCFCRAGALGWNNSINVFRDRRTPKTPRDRLLFARPFFSAMVKIYLVSLIGVFIESFLSPALLSLL